MLIKIRAATMCAAVFLMLGSAHFAAAGLYWVSPAGGASWANCGSATPLNGVSAGSLASANGNAAAGDTIYLRAGRYTTGIAPAHSGSANKRIVFAGHTGETARLCGMNTAVNAGGKSYITIDNITSDSNHVFVDLRAADHTTVLNCRFDHSTDTGGWPVGILMYNNSRYNRLANCTVGNSGYMTVNDDIGGLFNLGAWDNPADSTAFNLVENNSLYHGGHHVLELAARYCIIRNNTFHNDNWTACPRTSTNNLCGNRDIGVYDDNLDCYWNVFEGNRIAFAGASIDDATGASGLSLRSPHTIVRRNLFYLNDGPGMTLYADGSGTYDPRYNRVYHNVFFKNGVSPLSQSDFRYTFGLTFDNVAGNNPAIPIIGTVLKNNLFYQNTGGDLYLYYTAAAQQTILGNYYAAASYNSNPLAAIAGNTVGNADPKFVNAGAPATVGHIMDFDFHLQQGSPAIDKGVFLAVTTRAGSGAVVPVDDAACFMDGFGITGGDVIRMEGGMDTATVTAVDYAANTLTIDKTLVWAAGKGISLAYSGNAPDIGAYECEAAPALKTPSPGARSIDDAEFAVYTLQGRRIGGAQGPRSANLPCAPARKLPKGVFIRRALSSGPGDGNNSFIAF
jgi:hypothetical protein